MPHPNITRSLSPLQKCRILTLAHLRRERVLFAKLLSLARAGYDLDPLYEGEHGETMERYVRSVMAQRLPGRTGVVYAAWHPAFPGLVKIGLSHRAPEDRLADLTTAGIPGKFELLGATSVLDADAVEARVHRKLTLVRQERELFRVAPHEAIEVIRQTAALDFDLLRRRLERVLPHLVLPLYS